MTAIWTIFELAVNLFQGFILTYFPFKLLGGKKSNKYLKNYGVIFAVSIAVLITLMNRFLIFEHIYALSYIIPVIIFSIFFLNGSVLKKIFSSVYSIFIVLLMTALVTGLISVLFHKSFQEVIAEENWKKAVAMIITQLLILYSTMLSLKIFGRYTDDTHRLSKSEWILVISIFLLSILIGAILCLIALDNISDRNRVYISIGILMLIIINIVSFYLIIDLGRKNVSAMETEQLRLELSHNKQYVENAETEYQLIQKLRHDSKDIYRILNEYLERGETDKAKMYIKQLTDIADDRMIFVHTQNAALNAIINAKLTIAKSFGIHATCFSVDNFEGIEDLDLCRLLSNMLENAITATSKSRKEDKQISVRITEQNGQYSFVVKNTIEDSVLSKNPMLHSTKHDHKYHGYGTRITKDIAKKYDGLFDFYEENDNFCCMVVLNSHTTS